MQVTGNLKASNKDSKGKLTKVSIGNSHFLTRFPVLLLYPKAVTGILEEARPCLLGLAHEGMGKWGR